MTALIFYAALISVGALGYLAYGWKGAFWVGAVVIIPLLFLLSGLTWFSKNKLFKAWKLDPKKLDRIVEEVLKKDD